MKPVRVLSLIILSVMATGAMAQFTGPSSSASPSTVAGVADARLGSDVTLTGFVVEHQRDDYYTFRDDSGEIRVEIDRRVWGGRQVGPADKVRITGEVERGWRGRYIDVESLEVLQGEPT